MAVKVCHVTSLHSADDARIFQKECVSLTKDYEVYLVAPNVESHISNSVHIVGVQLPTINMRLQRLFKLHKLLKPLKEINADVYHFHDPELLRLGLRLKKRGKKIIFDSHEDVPNQILYKGYIYYPLRKILSKVYARFERYCLRQYDAVISVTGYIVERLKTINPNVYQITNYPILNENIKYDRKWERIICYAGLIVPHYHLKEIVSVLPEVNAKLYLAGFYATDNYLKELKGLPGWNSVDFLGSLKRNELIDLYGKVSIGMAIDSYDNPNVGFRKGSLGCTKAPEYMSYGLPIIVENSDVWGQVVKEYNCGIAIENPNDTNEIANAINTLLDDPERAKTMGENALKAARTEFNWNTQEVILLSLYKQLLSK